MRSLYSFTLMICVLVLAMLIMVADSSYGEGGKKRAPPAMAPSPSPSNDGGHFGGPKNSSTTSKHSHFHSLPTTNYLRNSGDYC
ncbi:hypothetical protein Bca52824_042007 [Brassica carinata]|uniref:Uncharacterized protein n=1 Tax=Brassica carinata TaxID=52824 RepID=A0A8X7RXL0_BRACI|nr:hypothetical protein Bca52824_042007 [Brassica carinata]